MKIDVEGHECEAIGGSRSILGKENDNFFISQYSTKKYLVNSYSGHIFIEWLHVNRGQKTGNPIFCQGNNLANNFLNSGYM